MKKLRNTEFNILSLSTLICTHSLMAVHWVPRFFEAHETTILVIKTLVYILPKVRYVSSPSCPYPYRLRLAYTAINWELYGYWLIIVLLDVGIINHHSLVLFLAVWFDNYLPLKHELCLWIGLKIKKNIVLCVISFFLGWWVVCRRDKSCVSFDIWWKIWWFVASVFTDDCNHVIRAHGKFWKNPCPLINEEEPVTHSALRPRRAILGLVVLCSMEFWNINFSEIS